MPESPKTAFLYVVAMTITGLVPPVGMMLLLRSHGTDDVGILFASQLVYLGVLSTTATKCGLDQWAFSRTIGGQKSSVDYSTLIRLRIVPFGALTTTIIGVATQTALPTICVAVSALLDAPSAIRASELTARQSYGRVITASWLNQPLFVGFLSLVTWLDFATTELLALGFTTTSLVRFLTLFAQKARESDESFISLVDTLRMGQQQVLNLIMFRADALITSLLPLGTFATLPSLAYLLRVPDIAGSGAALVATALMPRISAISTRDVRCLVGVWMLGAMLVTYIAWAFGPSPSVVGATVLALAINSALSLPVNLTVQQLLGNGDLETVLTLHRVSACGTCISALVMVSLGRFDLLPWVVSVSLFIFLLGSIGTFATRCSSGCPKRIQDNRSRNDMPDRDVAG